MKELTWPYAVLCIGIALSIGFILAAPTGMLAIVITAIGNFIQKIIAWIARLFS